MLVLIEADRDWSALTRTDIRDRTDFNYQTASEAQVSGDCWAIAYRRNDIKTVVSPGDGDTEIGLFVIGPLGNCTVPQTLTRTATAEHGQRPHVIHWQDMLLVAWDSSGEIWVSVYDVDWNPADTISSGPVRATLA